MTEATELRRLAVDLAKRAGDLIIDATAGGRSEKSSPTDLVTDADRAAEKLIFEGIRASRPQDTIVSEEGSVYEGGSGIVWVVDPLDGTINFVYGIPQWSVSIGIEGTVRAGVVHDPIKGETFVDDQPLRPSSQTELSQALIGTGFSYSADIRAKQAETLRGVLPRVRDIRRAGSAALDLAWVACGRLDGFYEDDTHHWDRSAGIALITAAGGSVRTHESLTIAAGNSKLLDQLESLVLANA